MRQARFQQTAGMPRVWDASLQAGRDSRFDSRFVYGFRVARCTQRFSSAAAETSKSIARRAMHIRRSAVSCSVR
jgi:hypothetical protein